MVRKAPMLVAFYNVTNTMHDWGFEGKRFSCDVVLLNKDEGHFLP